MRKQGTRVDDLKAEGRPGYVRIMRFGNFTQCEGSVEMIMLEADALELTGKLNDFFARKLEEREHKETAEKKS